MSYLNLSFLFWFTLDICMSMSKSVTQLCNKLQSATFHIPQRRLLIGNGVIHDKKKSCEELLQDIVDDDWGFSQGQFYKNRKLKENRKVLLSCSQTIVWLPR